MPPSLFAIPPGLPHYIRRLAHRALLDIMSKAPHEGGRRPRLLFTPRMPPSKYSLSHHFYTLRLPDLYVFTHCLALRVLIFVRHRLLA